jgi:hypothetical protein
MLKTAIVCLISLPLVKKRRTMTRLSHAIGIETKLLNPLFSLVETASITFFITSHLLRGLYKDAPFEKKCEFREIKLISSIQRERTPQ